MCVCVCKRLFEQHHLEGQTCRAETSRGGDSATGTQQGGPASSGAFCIAIQPELAALDAENEAINKMWRYQGRAQNTRNVSTRRFSAAQTSLEVEKCTHAWLSRSSQELPRVELVKATSSM